MSAARRIRDQSRRHSDGKYALGPQCYGCRKPAGEDYFSHPLTDSPEWTDTALVLCKKCAHATLNMTRVADFVAYQKAHGGGQ